MKPLGKAYNDAQVSGQFERLAPGGYVIKITGVEDIPDKEYLRITYDIAEGPERGRYKDEAPENAYRHQFIRSYKEKALGMFKAFIQAIDETEETNFGEMAEKGIDEKHLKGVRLGVVFGYEEYEANDGNVKERLYVANCTTAEKIRNGSYKVPELKKLKTASAPAGSPVPGFTPFNDEDVPF